MLEVFAMTKDVSPKVIGNLLIKLRDLNNLTQEELAKALDVSKSAISQWESGETGIKTEKLYDIAKFFNITVKELIEGKLDIEGDEEYFARNFNLDEFETFHELNDSNYHEVFEYLTRCNNVVKRLMKLYPLYINNKCTQKQHDEFRRLFNYFNIDYEYAQLVNIADPSRILDFVVEEIKYSQGCSTEAEIDFELRKLYEMKMKIHPITILNYGKDIHLLEMYYNVVGMEKANELLTTLCGNKKSEELEDDIYAKQLLSIGASIYYTFDTIYAPAYNNISQSSFEMLVGKITEDTDYADNVKMFKKIGSGLPSEYNFDEFYWKVFPQTATPLINKEKTDKVRNIVLLKNDQPYDYLKTLKSL